MGGMVWGKCTVRPPQKFELRSGRMPECTGAGKKPVNTEDVDRRLLQSSQPLRRQNRRSPETAMPGFRDYSERTPGCVAVV